LRPKYSKSHIDLDAVATDILAFSKYNRQGYEAVDELIAALFFAMDTSLESGMR
jgi:hypothetical protein